MIARNDFLVSPPLPFHPPWAFPANPKVRTPWAPPSYLPCPKKKNQPPILCPMILGSFREGEPAPPPFPPPQPPAQYKALKLPWLLAGSVNFQMAPWSLSCCRKRINKHTHTCRFSDLSFSSSVSNQSPSPWHTKKHKSATNMFLWFEYESPDWVPIPVNFQISMSSGVYLWLRDSFIKVWSVHHQACFTCSLASCCMSFIAVVSLLIILSFTALAAMELTHKIH